MRTRAVTLIALLAVVIQAFVVQTHIHVPAAPAEAGYSQSAGATHETEVASADDQRVFCALCQVLAGATLVPTAATASVAWQTSAEARLALTLAPRSHTHSWQSRAPPSFL